MFDFVKASAAETKADSQRHVQQLELKSLIQSGLIKGASAEIPSTPVETATDEIAQAASKGSVQAKLMMFAGIGDSPMHGPDAAIIDAYAQVDASTDAKLVFETGKLIQLGYLRCMNVISDQGAQTVTRLCAVPREANTYDQTIDYDASEKLAELRKARSDRYIWKAASLGYAPAQYEIGYRMQAVRDMPKDPTMGGLVSNQPATAWLQAAATQGYRPAGAVLETLQIAAKKDAAKAAKLAQAIAEHDKADPKCKEVIFSGIATPGWEGLIDQALKRDDLEDVIARNPIICSSTSGCYGLGSFMLKRGRIENWSTKYYWVWTPVDFDTGRRDILLAIRRQDAVCVMK
ncbi:hypothetical protein NLI96_g13152 [Meripilus lineatus]|uniref:Uncharacterized protein n=1 Tax=Meripilus lineatus TaxID=2056292 RepID=A0AAD5YBR5_9APHY|nr:hypothetical protein NLI96_g13152 [Physisporinus lineatus]